jgi:hypothetical protein
LNIFEFLKAACLWPAFLAMACLLGGCSPTLAPDAGGVLPVPSGDGATHWPDCTPTIAEAVHVPANFPPSFPLPSSFRLYKAATLGADTSNPQLMIAGFAPMSVSQASGYMQLQIPRTGYRFKFTDAEPGEAEAQIHGNGWIGGYKINNVPGCDDVSQWSIALGQLPH